MRAVFDTNVLRAGIRSRCRPEYRCLKFVSDGWVIPLAVPALFLEYEEVLKRPETLAGTGLTRAEVDEFLTGLAAVTVPVRVAFDWRPLLPDPDDDRVANAAINGMADCVVSGNVRHLQPVEERFGIPVLTPREFVSRLEDRIDQQASEEGE